MWIVDKLFLCCAEEIVPVVFFKLNAPWDKNQVVPNRSKISGSPIKIVLIFVKNSPRCQRGKFWVSSTFGLILVGFHKIRLKWLNTSDKAHYVVYILDRFVTFNLLCCIGNNIFQSLYIFIYFYSFHWFSSFWFSWLKSVIEKYMHCN